MRYRYIVTVSHNPEPVHSTPIWDTQASDLLIQYSRRSPSPLSWPTLSIRVRTLYLLLLWPLFVIPIVQTGLVNFEAIYTRNVMLSWLCRHHILHKHETYQSREKSLRTITSQDLIRRIITANVSYRVRHQVKMRKGSTKICAIDIGLSCTLWKEQPMTAGTKYIYRVVPR